EDECGNNDEVQIKVRAHHFKYSSNTSSASPVQSYGELVQKYGKGSVYEKPCPDCGYVVELQSISVHITENGCTKVYCPGPCEGGEDERYLLELLVGAMGKNQDCGEFQEGEYECGNNDEVQIKSLFKNMVGEGSVYEKPCPVCGYVVELQSSSVQITENGYTKVYCPKCFYSDKECEGGYEDEAFGYKLARKHDQSAHETTESEKYSIDFDQRSTDEDRTVSTIYISIPLISPPPPNITKEYSIATYNAFDLLTDDVTSEGDDTNKHLELMYKENKEENSKNLEDRVQQNDSTRQDLPPTVQPKTSSLPETNTDHQKPIDTESETIIICDSNVRYLKPK
ncbi:Hypothetical predicted protein, partial [Paramuricea clavata]